MNKDLINTSIIFTGIVGFTLFVLLAPEEIILNISQSFIVDLFMVIVGICMIILMLIALFLAIYIQVKDISKKKVN